MPSIKATLTGDNYTNWLIIKAKIGNGKNISNSKALEKLINQYNKGNRSKLI